MRQARGARADQPPMPPPTIAAIDDVWCGAQNGGTRRPDPTPASGARRPSGSTSPRSPPSPRAAAGSSAAARPASSCPPRAVRAATGDARRPRRSPPPSAPRPGPSTSARSSFLAIAGAGAGAVRRRRRGRQRRRRSAAQPDDHLGEAWTRRPRCTPGTRAASATFWAATTTVSEPGLGRDHRRQHPGHRAQPPVQAQLGQEHLPRRGRQRQAVVGGEDRHRDRQVEAAAALGQGGGREADRDLRVRPALAAVDDRRADPVPRLAQRRVRQADQDRRGQPAGDVRLHLDQVARGRRRAQPSRCGRAAI